MKKLLLCFLPATMLFAQAHGSAKADFGLGDLKPLKPVMDSLDDQVDAWENVFEAALDKSGYNGSNTEDTLLRWADLFEDEIDDMEEAAGRNNQAEFVYHFQNAMTVGAAINRAMLRKDFAANAETQWSAVRKSLNHIAAAGGMPVLPNVTVIAWTAASPEVLTKPDIRQVLERLENTTDVFEDKFKANVRQNTANSLDRQRAYTRWADYLEHVTDDMLEEWKENDANGFQEELERTLMVTEALAHVMARGNFGANAGNEWRALRNDLNIVAQAFGYPVIGEPIASR